MPPARKKSYKLEPGSIQDQFRKSRAKIQFFGGGYANGKTTAMVVKALEVARDYPGANILVARATRPKLDDTIRRVWFEWMPPHWKEDFHKTNNTLTLKNGSVVNFRHLAQSGKGSGEDTTSNVLSATYDLVVVDQIEDPEIQEKDFLDLMGRLRGDTRYAGSDPSMPIAGPRWFLLACNPTRNWVYRKLVRPLHRFQKGIRDPELLVDEKTGEPIIELFEGSTYTNAANLNETGDDYIRGLEATYRGQMRDRYLGGQWVAYEGLVYPEFDESTHVLQHSAIIGYLHELLTNDYQIQFLEGYDHGLRSQSCYLVSFVDHRGNVFVFDGFYEREYTISKSSEHIRAIRSLYDIEPSQPIYADPQIFRRQGTSNSSVVGVAVSQLFYEEQIEMQRANNDMVNGIAKVQSYIAVERYRRHPVTQESGAPAIFFSSKLDFVLNEFGDYNWKREAHVGTDSDKPMDRNDHAMDTIKYMLSVRPPAGRLVVPMHKRVAAYTRWHEFAQQKQDPRKHRHV